MNTTTLPVACTLTAPELQQRRSTLLQKIKSAVEETKELEDGYGYRLPSNDEWITELAHLITLERQCCPFLNFQLRLEASAPQTIWLELTGPAGTKEFLSTLLS